MRTAPSHQGQWLANLFSIARTLRQARPNQAKQQRNDDEMQPKISVGVFRTSNNYNGKPVDRCISTTLVHIKATALKELFKSLAALLLIIPLFHDFSGHFKLSSDAGLENPSQLGFHG